MKQKILIVDPVPIVRYGLTQLINTENDLVVCGEAVNAPEAVQLTEGLKPDLVITDITIDSLNGIEIIRQLKAIQRDLPILVYTLHDEYLYGERAFRAGAKGYVKKADPPEVVRNAIRKVLNGYLYLSDDMARTLFDRKYKESPELNESESPIDRLSNRELEIFELISKGLKPTQMAEKLNISVKTVENYRVHIREKLHLDSLSQLIQYAMEWYRGSGDLLRRAKRLNSAAAAIPPAVTPVPASVAPAAVPEVSDSVSNVKPLRPRKAAKSPGAGKSNKDLLVDVNVA
ncbi:MAG: response regulator [bacterium]